MKSRNIRELFLKLNSKAIAWCCITPKCELSAGGDIDLFIKPDHKESFLSLLHEDGWLERRLPSLNIVHHYYYKNYNGVIEKLDVRYGISYHVSSYTYRYINENDVFSHCVKYKDISYPRNYDYYILYSMHSYIDELGVSRSENDHLRHVTNITDIYDQLTREKNDLELASRIKKLHKLIIDKGYKKEILNILKGYFHGDNSVNEREGHQAITSYNILFLGADGSGKSSLINDMAKQLKIKNKQFYFGERNWVFHINSYLVLSSNIALRIIYNWFTFPLDLYVRNKRLSSYSNGKVALIDRFPGFPFIKNGMMRKIYDYCLPRINTIVLLSGDPEIFVSRKPEVSVDKNFSDQNKFFKVSKLVSSNKVINIDTSKNGITESGQILINELFKDQIFLQSQFKPIVNARRNN